VTDGRVRGAYSSRAPHYIELFDRMAETDVDVAFVRRHLEGVAGTVLDLGCGPGQWSGWLHDLGLDVLGIDLVPAFVAHARWRHPGPSYQVGSMTDLDLPDASVAGVLAWFSTIHLPPDELDVALAGVRRVVADGGPVVVGFFDSEEAVTPFDHAVTTAWRWPVDALAARLDAAGLQEVDRLRWTLPDRPDRRYAALATRAS
jgi:SAM-dependent methyltransferase